MAFLIFGLFWMVNDHAPWWVIALFTIFQLWESIPTVNPEVYLLQEIARRLRNVR